jgi:carboxypeptidase C (cathepsin A)
MKEEFTTNTRRWYDRDPVLSSAMKTLEETDDETQIKIALNLIKIITEHNISNSEYESVEDIVSATEDVLENTKKGRWYDIDSTLRTAITLLQNCPDSTRSVIAKEMAKNVIEIIKKDEDEEDTEEVSEE